MTDVGCPKRRAYERGSGRVPSIVSQHGIQLRVLLALLALIPALTVITDGPSILLQAINEHRGIGVGIASAMVILGGGLVVDWIANDEMERVRGKPLLCALRDRRDIASTGIAVCWAGMLMLLLVHRAYDGPVAPVGGWVWLCSMLIVFGFLEAIEDAWRRGANGP